MEYSFSSLTVSRLFLHLRRVAAETEAESGSEDSTMRPLSVAYKHRSSPSTSTTMSRRSDLLNIDRTLSGILGIDDINTDQTSPLTVSVVTTPPETRKTLTGSSRYIGQQPVRQSTLIKVAPFNYAWKDVERALPPLPKET
jgi:hypothetical protein